MILKTLRTCLLCLGAFAPAMVHAADLPNILWLTSEDNGPQLGAYGDPFADTPILDALAAKGMIYLHAWSNAPVCAPARTAIITGMYPQSLGAQHMRSEVPVPAGMQLFPQLLRERGYYCTNNQKEDYNIIKPEGLWDESSGTAHWKNRKDGQPFFAVFNYTVTHESQIRQRPHEAQHDPAKVPIPAYHPDTPEVRQDWAQYYDKMTEMDGMVGEALRELEAAGLADDTIVFYYGDHGPGMPRGKRWTYESGLRVPLIVYVPEKFRERAPEDYVPGGTSKRLVSFVDLAPTVLSLAGVEPPEYLHGRAFMGEHETTQPEYMFGFRDRMDERIDMTRAVRNERFAYIRNYMPHRPYGQYLEYMFQTPTTVVWKRLYDEGKLNEAQRAFWEEKPVEELYDLEADPDQVNNLAADMHTWWELVQSLRDVLERHVYEIKDLGFLPEADMHRRAGDGAPYDIWRNDDENMRGQIMSAARITTRRLRDLSDADLTEYKEEVLEKALNAPDSAVRYWGAIAFLVNGGEIVQDNLTLLRNALNDDSPNVAIVAAEALGRYGEERDIEPAMKKLLEFANLDKHDVYTAVAALNAIDFLGEKAAPYQDEIVALPEEQAGLSGRLNSYVPRLKKTLADLGSGER